jgi:hypothetical protein
VHGVEFSRLKWNKLCAVKDRRTLSIPKSHYSYDPDNLATISENSLSLLCSFLSRPPEVILLTLQTSSSSSFRSKLAGPQRKHSLAEEGVKKGQSFRHTIKTCFLGIRLPA